MKKVKFYVRWGQSYGEGHSQCQDQGQVQVGKGLTMNWVRVSVYVSQGDE